MMNTYTVSVYQHEVGKVAEYVTNIKPSRGDIIEVKPDHLVVVINVFYAYNTPNRIGVDVRDHENGESFAVDSVIDKE